MFLIYANVSSLESRGLFMRSYTCTVRHFPDENRHSFFLEFNNDYNLQSMLVFSYHVAIIPFSWKFGFDKLSKYDELC